MRIGANVLRRSRNLVAGVASASAQEPGFPNRSIAIDGPSIRTKSMCTHRSSFRAISIGHNESFIERVWERILSSHAATFAIRGRCRVTRNRRV